jgi:hypothetical protein
MLRIIICNVSFVTVLFLLCGISCNSGWNVTVQRQPFLRLNTRVSLLHFLVPIHYEYSCIVIIKQSNATAFLIGLSMSALCRAQYASEMSTNRALSKLRPIWDLTSRCWIWRRCGFWDVLSCSLVYRYWRFGGTCCPFMAEEWLFLSRDGMFLITILTISDMRIAHTTIPVSKLLAFRNSGSLFIVSLRMANFSPTLNLAKDISYGSGEIINQTT